MQEPFRTGGPKWSLYRAPFQLCHCPLPKGGRRLSFHSWRLLGTHSIRRPQTSLRSNLNVTPWKWRHQEKVIPPCIHRHSKCSQYYLKLFKKRLALTQSGQGGDTAQLNQSNIANWPDNCLACHLTTVQYCQVLQCLKQLPPLEQVLKNTHTHTRVLKRVAKALFTFFIASQQEPLHESISHIYGNFVKHG